MSWCLDQQIEVVRRVLEGASDLANRNAVATLNLLLFASSRIPKLALISLGSLRCNDLSKERGDLEEYVVKMVRKALRTTIKEVCSLDASRIVEKLRLVGEARSSVERSLSNVSARARTSLQRKLAPLYEELEKRFREMKSAIDLLERSELVSKGLDIVAQRVENVLSRGFLSEEEISKIVDVALGILSTETEKSFKRIAPRLGVTVNELRSIALDWGFVRERIEATVRRAAKLLKCFVASSLVNHVLSRIGSMVINPSQPSEAIDPRNLVLSGFDRVVRVLLECLSAIR